MPMLESNVVIGGTVGGRLHFLEPVLYCRSSRPVCVELSCFPSNRPSYRSVIGLLRKPAESPLRSLLFDEADVCP